MSFDSIRLNPVGYSGYQTIPESVSSEKRPGFFARLFCCRGDSAVEPLATREVSREMSHRTASRVSSSSGLNVRSTSKKKYKKKKKF